ncbi:MAG: metallophosphoesterase [Deltaproteobacteria bacterium]|nr:metallophosphoesterase [Deltaproteobacteria bacterium]
MWFIFFFAFIAIAVLHAMYFSRTLLDAIEEVWPRVRPRRRLLRRSYLVLACSMPVLLLLFVIYIFIASPDSWAFPENDALDVLLVYPYWFVTIWSFQCSLFIVPLGLVHWLLRKAGRANGRSWERRRRFAVLAIAIVFLVYVPARTIHDRTTLETRQYQLLVDDLPVDLDGFKVALVSDPQADRYTGDDSLAEMVDAVNAEKPDLVLVAGDIITRSPEYIDMAARQLGRLEARHGVYSCVGDHDNFMYRDRERSVREVKEGLARYGVPMLDNQVVDLEVGDATLAVVVATNNYVTRLGPGTARKLISGASSADARVLVAHQSGDALISAARDGGIHLFAAGHTHGGQVSFVTPLGLLVLAEIETPYVVGRYQVGPMALVVSAGIGMSVTPFRYHSPKSVDVVTFKRRARPAAASAAPLRAGGRPARP